MPAKENIEVPGSIRDAALANLSAWFGDELDRRCYEALVGKVYMRRVVIKFSVEVLDVLGK